MINKNLLSLYTTLSSVVYMPWQIKFRNVMLCLVAEHSFYVKTKIKKDKFCDFKLYESMNGR